MRASERLLEASYVGCAALERRQVVRRCVRSVQPAHQNSKNDENLENAQQRVDEMCKKLADVLGVDCEQISLKATTTERLGFIGREEGMAAQAVALVECWG